jgi:hypothetical protein
VLGHISQSGASPFVIEVALLGCTLRAKIDETVLPVVITEQGEKRNQS